MRDRQAQGDLAAVRWADDFVVGFQHRPEAERFLTELRASSLGFTHSCARTRAGKFAVLRRTMRQRLRAKLKEVTT
jgi:hypothetical protein